MGAGIVFASYNDILTYEHFGRCVQIAHIGYAERLTAAQTRYSVEIARIIADRPLERDEAYRLAVRLRLVRN